MKPRDVRRRLFLPGSRRLRFAKKNRLLYYAGGLCLTIFDFPSRKFRCATQRREIGCCAKKRGRMFVNGSGSYKQIHYVGSRTIFFMKLRIDR
jgi:hypothetical protein